MTKTHGLIGKGMSFLNKSKLVNDIEGNVVEIKACELQFCYNEDEDLVIWETYEENSRGQFPSVIVGENIVSLEMNRKRIKNNYNCECNFTEACKTISNTILQEEVFEKVINKKVKINETTYETEVIITQVGPKHFHMIIDFIYIR